MSEHAPAPLLPQESPDVNPDDANDAVGMAFENNELIDRMNEGNPVENSVQIIAANSRRIGEIVGREVVDVRPKYSPERPVREPLASIAVRPFDVRPSRTMVVNHDGRFVEEGRLEQPLPGTTTPHPQMGRRVRVR